MLLDVIPFRYSAVVDEVDDVRGLNAQSQPALIVAWAVLNAVYILIEGAERIQRSVAAAHRARY